MVTIDIETSMIKIGYVIIKLFYDFEIISTEMIINKTTLGN